MSSIYITEPPTSGKVLIVTTRGDIDVELWYGLIGTHLLLTQLCRLVSLPSTQAHRMLIGLLWGAGAKKRQRHAAISSSCAWRDTTITPSSTA